MTAGLLRVSACVRARPPDVVRGPPLEVEGVRCRPLLPGPGQLVTSLEVSFETACLELARFDRLLVEPDGAFVWVSDWPRWQLDGNLMDRDGRLLLVELNGTIAAVDFDRLLAVLGWPERSLLFELPRAGVYLDEADFRLLAGGC